MPTVGAIDLNIGLGEVVSVLVAAAWWWFRHQDSKLDEARERRLSDLESNMKNTQTKISGLEMQSAVMANDVKHIVSSLEGMKGHLSDQDAALQAGFQRLQDAMNRKVDRGSVTDRLRAQAESRSTDG
jgi:hypothetical protein